MVENRATIRKYGIGVVLTKDSGTAGGVPEKLEAARLEGCRVVVVRRPEQTGEYFDQMEPLLKTLLEVLT
jgi:precorrin-6A/cobalt-precorrin-6A reductase